MQLADINPFVRYAELQTALIIGAVSHASYDCRLFYILEGRGTIKINNVTCEVAENTAIYIPPAVFYKFSGEFKAIVLNFDASRKNTAKTEAIAPSRRADFDRDKILENTLPDELTAPITVKNAYETKALFEKCVSHFKANGLLKDGYTSSATKHILMVLFSISMNEEGETQKLAERVMLYIKANFDRELTNESIAAFFGYHPFYLNRIFKAHIGITIHKALIDARIDIARQLLIGTDIRIGEIERRCGFGSRSQFIEAFTKSEGMSPNLFRLTARGGKK